MKTKQRFLTALVMAIVMMAMSPIRVWADTASNFMVMSDMHVMSKSLFDDGTAFTAYVQTEPKLVENSQDVFDAAIAKIKTAKPQFVLIPGDLSKDGEKVSHEYVAAKLKELVAEGIKVYVIPGNHDIGNPNAKSYLGDAPAAVPSLTADEWKSADFYQSCGYASAVETSGLSYMAYPADGIALIALDSRKPDTETTHYNEGGLTEATLAWAETAAAKARKEGRVVIGMMHHPIVEHFDGHKDIGPTYLANQAEGYPALADDGEVAGVQQRLVAAGIGTMFTGHFHLQSIQYEETSAGKLYDVMTGSLSSYPMAMRSGTIATDGNISVASITDVASDELIAKAKTRNAITTQEVFAVLANKMAEKIAAIKAQNPNMAYLMSGVPSSQSEIMALLNTHMRDSYEVLMNSLALGDEEQDNPDTKITACKDAYNSFLNNLFSSMVMTPMGPAMIEQCLAMVQDYTQANTAMVTSVFQNTKGTGPVVADNTNTSLKTIPLPTIDADTWKSVLAEINDARVSYDQPYTITFADSNNDLPAEKDADTNEDVVLNADGTIKLYHAENDYNYIVAPTTAGDVIMAPADCRELFAGLTNLTSVTFDNFNTSNVTDMDCMFSDCHYLGNIAFGENFNTSNVEDMHAMFSGCWSLSSLDLSGFNTSKVKYMGGMFAGCESLTNLYLGNFNTSKVTDMTDMFSNCCYLQSLTIGNFDMSSVEDSDDMFDACNRLTTLTMKSLPYLVDGTFNNQFSGEDITVNVVLDDNSVVYVPYFGEDGWVYSNYPEPTVAPTYTRTVKADSKWGTVVLPFRAAAENDDVQMYFLDVVTFNDEGEGSMKFIKEKNSVYPNTPGVFKKKNATATTVTFTGAKDTETGKYAVGAIEDPDDDRGSYGSDYWYIHGTYSEKTDVVEEGLNNSTTYTTYFIAENKFWRADVGITVAPFRAWFWYFEDEGDYYAPARTFNIVEADETEGIELIEREDGTLYMVNGKCFDLQGRQIKEGQKGLQVRDGKVVFLR